MQGWFVKTGRFKGGLNAERQRGRERGGKEEVKQL
jgi:hypothetical protein